MTSKFLETFAIDLQPVGEVGELSRRRQAMDNGWDRSSASLGRLHGRARDWAREHVLDPVMLGRVAAGAV